MAECRIKTQLYLHPSLVCLDQSHADLQVNLWFLLESMEILALLSKGRMSSLLEDQLLLMISEQLSVFFVFILTQAKLPALSGAWPLEWRGLEKNGRFGLLWCRGGRKIISPGSCIFKR